MEREKGNFWLVRPGEKPHVVREALPPAYYSATVDPSSFLLIRGYVEDCKTGERFAVRKGIDLVISIPPSPTKTRVCEHT